MGRGFAAQPLEELLDGIVDARIGLARQVSDDGGRDGVVRRNDDVPRVAQSPVD
jgi:hypothetical protein